jgi:uncharacterized protein (DUF433 family)
MTDMYEGRDPREIPAYTVGETAYYLRVSDSTLRHWLAGHSYKTSQGTTRALPVIHVARRRPYTLSFYNMIEVHVLRALRVREDVPLQRIRKALQFVEQQIRTPHPLVNQAFETDGLDLFVEHYGQLINASQGGRIEVRKAMQDTLRRIDRDDAGEAARFFLWARDPLEEKKVSVDPRVSFGRAVLVGTGLPISVLADRSRGGDSAKVIADDYRVKLEDVETALQWEPRAKAA